MSRSFPILVINTGSLAACSTMASKGYTIKSWMKLWAEELVLARNCVTDVLLPLLRPDLPTTYQNRHFHSAETLETIFMRRVLQEVQQRCFAVSIIWLHDGFWISSTVRDDIIREAEQTALKSFFPDSCQGERLLRITSLSEEVAKAKEHLAALKPSVLFPHCGHNRRRAPKFTREFPKAKFISRQISNAKQLLILPALQNGSGPNSCVESQYVVAVASFWLRLTIGTFATPFD